MVRADEFALLTNTGSTPPAAPAPAASMDVDEAPRAEGQVTEGAAAAAAAAAAQARAVVQEELLGRLLDDMAVHSRAEVGLQKDERQRTCAHTTC